ncbi:TPA: hypothetical protein SMT33_003022 [Proteus mirabilis]|nr:hypothetical protein [Proteus mirabilis]
MFLCEVNRNHHYVSLRYFGHLRLTRQQEGSPPVTLPRHTDAHHQNNAHGHYRFA